jgi:hypothetical protein
MIRNEIRTPTVNPITEIIEERITMFKKCFLLAIFLLLGVIPVSSVLACGGLFCQNVPVDQQAERIIFAVNDDGTISAYVQINYTGSAPDFSWVVPVPSVPEVDVAEMTTFDELQRLTDPIIISPQIPACAPIAVPAMAMEDSAAGGGVQVHASGLAGPFVFDVVSSEDPEALIVWLEDNDYRITDEMKPLIAVYTEEGLFFLAMKLQPEQGVQDIQPVVMTYLSDHPMIPIRLTAVAAIENMSIYTWIFADEQAYTTNYARPTIADEAIRGDFFQFGGTNYMNVVDQTVDLYQGRAFITEYAQPTREFEQLFPQDELLKQLVRDYDYVTRFFGRMSPKDMTVDPTFDFSANLQDVSNVRDLTGIDEEIFWGCQNVPVQIEYDSSVVPDGF